MENGPGLKVYFPLKMGIFHGVQPLETVSLEEQFSGPFAVSLGMLTPLRGKAQDLSCHTQIRGNQTKRPRGNHEEKKGEQQGTHRCIHCILFVSLICFLFVKGAVIKIVQF